MAVMRSTALYMGFRYGGTLYLLKPTLAFVFFHVALLATLSVLRQCCISSAKAQGNSVSYAQASYMYFHICILFVIGFN